MTAVSERVANFRALGRRKSEIRDMCNSILAESLDSLIAQLRGGCINGYWTSMYQRVEASNQKRYPLPEQKGILDAANGFAAGLIERFEERAYLNMADPAYVDFIKKHSRLPEPGDLY